MSDAQETQEFEKLPPCDFSVETQVEIAKDTDESSSSDTVSGAGFAFGGAAREVHVTIQNLTGHNFILVDFGTRPNCCWKKEPPSRINYHDRQSFQVDSNGFMAGAHGWAQYEFEDDYEKGFYFRFDNPYFGPNTYNYKAPDGYGSNIVGGEGDHAFVTFQCWKANS